MPIVWNAEQKQYERRGDGDRDGPIPMSDVRGLSESSLAASRTVMQEWITAFFEGSISLGELDARGRQEIKEEVIRQYVLGHGGRESMTFADWGSCGGMIGSQYSPYWVDFMAELGAEQVAEGQAAVRAAMYANSAREAFEKAVARNMAALGVELEKWVLGVAEHCQDCIDFSAEGWQAIGYFPFPGDGSTICLTNCQCHKEYKIEKTEQAAE